MVKILFAWQAILFLIFFHLILYKRDFRGAMFAALILVKTGIIALLILKTDTPPLLIWAFAGAVLIFTFVAAVTAGGEIKEVISSKKDYFMVLGFLILVLIFSGCGAKKFPEVDGEINLSFIPAKIICYNDELFVSEERGNKIHVFDIKNKAEIEQIEAGNMVYDMLIDGKFLYTANKASDNITVYDMETKQKHDIKAGGVGPVALSIYPEKKKLYVANITSSNVGVIDLNSSTVEAKIETGKWPSDLYLSQDKKYLYVSCQYTNTIELVDTEKERNVLVTIPVGTSPVAIIPLGGKNLAIVHEWEYAFNNQSNIVIIDRTKYSVVKSILIDGGVYSGELAKSKKYLFLTVPAKDKIIFVDIKHGAKVFEIQCKDDFPKWLALSPNGKTLYIAAQHTKKIIIVKTNGLI